MYRAVLTNLKPFAFRYEAIRSSRSVIIWQHSMAPNMLTAHQISKSYSINHLAIPSRERFEQALSAFDGTILAVVHDRYSIKRFTTELWILEEKSIRREFLSGFPVA